MSFSITILGSSSAIPTSERYTSAHLLNADEHFYLIDCGEATQIQLKKYKCKIGKINNIFISHLHGDHVFGLFGLLSTYLLLERATPLNIFGPAEIKEFIDFFLKHFGKGITYNINIININHRRREKIFEDDKITVHSFPLKHSIPVNGFKFIEKQKPLNVIKDKIDEYNISLSDIVKIKKGENLTLNNGTIILNPELTLPPYKSRSYAFCTDTAFYERITEDVAGVDILYHESTFNKNDIRRARQTMHSTSIQAAEIARKANVGKLIIGHFSARYKEDEIASLQNEARTVFPSTFIANEGETHKIDLKRLPKK